MPRLTAVLLALVYVTVGRGAHAQSGDARFSCEPGDPQARRTVTATFGSTDEGSVSDILGTVYGTQIHPGIAAQPVSDAEFQALVSALASKERSNLADTRVTLYRIETSGRQPHVFAAYVWPILPDDPGVIAVGEDLVYVLDAGYGVLFYTLAVPSDAF